MKYIKIFENFHDEDPSDWEIEELQSKLEELYDEGSEILRDASNLLGIDEDLEAWEAIKR